MEEIWQLLTPSKHMPHPSMSQKVLEETPAPIKYKPNGHYITKYLLFIHPRNNEIEALIKGK